MIICNMQELCSRIERDLWLKYYEIYLNGDNKLSAHIAAERADDVVRELNIRNKVGDEDDV